MTCTDSPSKTAYDNLVQLACSLRPSWQSPGVKAAIRKALDREAVFTFAELAYAVVTIAADKGQKTPAPIAFDGPHWKRAAAVTAPTGARWEDRCSICSYPLAGCSGKRMGDHAFVPRSAARPGVRPPADLDGTVRTAIVEARAGLCTLHGAATCTTCERTKTEGVGTGASGGDDRAEAEATLRVNRSVDYPEAPAQAHPLTDAEETTDAE